MYYTNVLDLIGNTPLISLEQTTGLQLYAKAEFLNPGGSIKDRIALEMIEDAKGKIKETADTAIKTLKERTEDLKAKIANKKSQQSEDEETEEEQA